MNNCDIVICGFPRSGSTLLYTLLMQTVATHWFPEGEYGYPAMRAVVEGRTFDSTITINSAFYEPFADIFNQPYRKGPVNDERPFISKQPYDIFRARDEIIPDEVPLIVTIRDLRDVLLSKHKAVNALGVDDYFIDADFKYTWRSLEDLGKKGPGLLDYAAAIKTVRDRRRGKDMDNLYLCRYERLVSEPDVVQRELVALGIAYNKGALFSDWNSPKNTQKLDEKYHEFGMALGSIRAIDSLNTNKWKKTENKARIAEQFSEFPELYEYLAMFGYSE